MPSSAFPSVLLLTLFPYTTLFRSGSSNFLMGLEPLAPSRNVSLCIRRRICRRDGLDFGVLLEPLECFIASQLSFHPIEGSLLCQTRDRKSTRLNSSHRCISYAVFCFPVRPSSYTFSLHDALPIWFVEFSHGIRAACTQPECFTLHPSPHLPPRRS